MPKKKSFVLNDESVVNSYGFRTKNPGIDLTRFTDNPVLLDQHSNSTNAVLGRWTNIRVEGSQLLADAEFDSEDAAAKLIEGKVDRGFIKGVSMGISFNRENMVKNPDGTYDLIKSEIYEASIVAIPSNKNSLKLYHESGELMDENEIKLSLSELQTNPSNNPNTDMNKIVLQVATLLALGLQNADDNIQLATAIEKMAKDLADAKQKLVDAEASKLALETKLKTFTEASATAIVDKAILEGKLSVDLKDSFVKMALVDLEAVTKTLASLPTKITLGSQVNNTEVGEVKTQDDFQKLTDEQQLAWKEKCPEAYEKLFS